jgi:hypothetical protein
LKTVSFTGVFRVICPGYSSARTTWIVDSEDITPLVKAAIFSVNAGLITKDLLFLHCTVKKRVEIMKRLRITR